ncbi:hypothetical protein F5883DRAFT_233004 [Diaporthe sp. PMI_573]|nr:hypothetical protein F5883DRAFT_233004 [Diaporthaceae sp. PMI_573]
MAQVPDYSGLEVQWQVDCANWNSNITATNHRQPALVHHETARIACAILANNMWDGYLTADTPDGPAVPLDNPDCILTADRYYFHHPSDPKYPVVADFESWEFPTSTPGQLPSYWRSLAIPRPQIPQFPHTPARCCAVTGRHN